jgi:serine/threonine-protein kinase
MIPSSADPERWRRLSALLDEALDLAAEERAAWLGRCGRASPILVTELEEMLADHAASERARFLTGSAGRRAAARRRRDPRRQTLGAYTLERPIGQGGMGSVWLAHRSDGRYAGAVAVKLLNVSLIGRTGGERFKREGASSPASSTRTSPACWMPA